MTLVALEGTFLGKLARREMTTEVVATGRGVCTGTLISCALLGRGAVYVGFVMPLEVLSRCENAILTAHSARKLWLVTSMIRCNMIAKGPM